MKILVASNGVHKVTVATVDRSGPMRTSGLETLGNVYEVTIDGDVLMIRQGVKGDPGNPWKISIIPWSTVTDLEIVEQPK